MFSHVFTAATACALFAAASASSDAFPFTNEPAHQLVNRADVVITTGATTGVKPRFEIRNLATRKDQWALYIQAMAKWQQAGEEDDSSYYEVSSIHGKPPRDWNGAQRCDGCSDDVGYAAHNNVLFPTWHRAFMMLHEQKLLEVALEVANSYPPSSRPRMLAAYEELRMPFWDPAARAESNATCLPEIYTSPKITIEGPDGPETLDNPLYSFHFTEAQAKDNYYPIFTDWLQTLRYPTSNSPDATSADASAVATLDRVQESFQDQIYQLLTACDDYLYFSNEKAGATSKCVSSLEVLHDSAHMWAGGNGAKGVSGGHMTYLPLSSYEPMFWAWHCNVDRLFQLWLTINPDSYVPSATVPHSSWAIAAGETVNADYPLKPFNKDATSYLTSNDLRETAPLGYTYPEYVTSDGTKSDIAAYINGLYGSKATLTASSISDLIPSNQISSNVTKTPSSTRGNNSTGLLGSIGVHFGGPKHGVSLPTYSTPSGHSGGLGGGLSSLIDTITNGVEDLLDSFLDSVTGNAYEYVVNIQTPRNSLGGSYVVLVFNGAPESESPADWLQDKNLIGTMGVLSAPGGMPGHELLVTGQIPLTRTLRSMVTAGSLLGMDEDEILPYLTKHLQWRISKDGEEVDVDSVEGFKAAVYSSQASVPKSVGELPSYTKYAPQVEVTKGKAGGASKPIFGHGGDESDDSSNAPSYDSESSTSSSKEASKPTDTYSPESHAPSTASYVSPTSLATAPAGVKPSAYGSLATVSPVVETCPPVTATVKRVETIYVTEASSPSGPIFTAPASSVVTVVPVPPKPAGPVAPYPILSASKPTGPVAPHPILSASKPVYYPSGTGKVYPSSPVQYTGAANVLNAAGLFAGFGAIIAFFM